MNTLNDAGENYTAHDLGGASGFGAVDRSQTTQFAHDWEASVFAMTLACGMLGRWNLDQSRSARERMDAAHYLRSSYYEHWLHGLELLLRDNGLIDGDDEHNLQAVNVDRVAEILASGAPTLLPSKTKPRFTVGEKVMVREVKSDYAHTRAPRYARGNDRRNYASSRRAHFPRPTRRQRRKTTATFIQCPF